MKHLMLAVALLGSFPLALSAQVSKEDLKRLASGGISDEVILNFVKSHGPVAKLSPEDVIDLKKAGLKESLLAEVLKVSAAPTPPPGTPSSVAPASPYYTNPSAVYDDAYTYYYPYYYPYYDYGYWGYPWWGLGFGYYGGRYWGYRGYPYRGGTYGSRYGWSGGHYGGSLGGAHGGGHAGGHR